MRCSMHPSDEAIGVCVLCGAAVCPQCQRSAKGKTLCALCWAELRTGDNPNAPNIVSPTRPLRRKSPFFAFLLGLIPGLGHLFLGQIHKGIVSLGAALLIGYIAFNFIPSIVLLLPLLIAYSAFDSAHTARRMNVGEPIQDWKVGDMVQKHFGINPSWSFVLGVGLILLGGLLLLESLGQWSVWIWQLPASVRLVGRNLLALFMVAAGGYLLWKTVRSSRL